MSFWAWFNQWTTKIALGTICTLYFVSFAGSLFYMFYLCFTQSTNWRLMVMVAAMMVVAISIPLAEILYLHGYNKSAVIFGALNDSF